MKIIRSASSLVAAFILALAGLGLTAAAHANDVYWSIGLSSPGIQVGVGGGARPYVINPPVYVQPYPVYGQAYPVHGQPYPVVVAPRPFVNVYPAPIYVPQPQYIYNDWQRPGHGWRHGHGRHDRDRYESNRYDGGQSGHGHHGRR
jgi:hypothetical protein